MTTINDIKDLVLKSHFTDGDIAFLSQMEGDVSLEDISPENLQKLSEIQQKTKPIMDKVEQVVKKVTPELLKKTLKTGVLPAGLSKKEQGELSFAVNTLTKGDLSEWISGGKIDLTGAKGSREAAQRVGNKLLERAGVDGQIVNVDNVSYIKDSKGDFYLVGNNPAQVVSTIVDLLPAVGGIGGMILGSAAGPAGMALGGILGSGAGAMLSQGAREGIEATVEGRPVFGVGNAANVVGAGVGDAGTALVANTALKGAGVVLKYIPGASPLGRYLGTNTKLVVRAASRTNAGKSLRQFATKANKAYLEPWFQNLNASVSNTPALKQFHQIAAGLEKSPIGSLLLGVEGNILKDATKNVKAGETGIGKIIKDLQARVESHRATILAHETALAHLTPKEKALQQEVFKRKGPQNTVEMGNFLNGKIKAHLADKVNGFIDDLHKVLHIETKRLGIDPVNVAAHQNLATAQQSIEQHSQQIGNEIDNRISTLKAKGEEMKLESKQAVAGMKSRFAKEEADTAASRAAREQELTRQAQQDFETQTAVHGKILNGAREDFHNSLNQIDTPEAVGGMMREKVTNKWNNQLAEERLAYQEALKAAPGDKTAHDISGFMTSLKQGIDPKSSEAAKVTLERLNALKFDPSKATAKDLFAVKDIVGDALGDTRNFTKSTYAHLAEKRSELATGTNSIFGKSKSPVVKDYQATSAARVARNDAIQAEDYANFIGEHLDSTTGQISRNQQTGQDVFDNLVSLSNKDKGFAERVLNYAKLTPEENAAIAKAHVRNTYVNEGGDATKTVKAILKNSGDVGSVSNKNLFNLTHTPTEELNKLQELAKLEQVKIVNPAKDVSSSLEQAAQAKAAENAAALEQLKIDNNTKVADTVTSKVAAHKDLGKYASGTALTHSNVTNNLQELEKYLPNSLQVGDGQTANTFKEFALKNPQQAGKLMDELGMTEVEKYDTFRSLYMPNKDVIAEAQHGIKGSDIIKNLGDPAGVVTPGADKFVGFGKGNQQAIAEDLGKVIDLADTQRSIEAANQGITSTGKLLDRDQASLANKISQQNEQTLRSVSDNAMRGGLGMLAGAGLSFIPGIAGAGDVAMTAAGLLASPAVRNAVGRGVNATVQGVASGARPVLNALAQESVPAAAPRLADLLGAINQPTTTPSAEQIQQNPDVLRGFAQSNEAEQMMLEELKRKGLLQLGAF